MTNEKKNERQDSLLADEEFDFFFVRNRSRIRKSSTLSNDSKKSLKMIDTPNTQK